MPAIRDFASNYTTVTTGTTIIIPVPAVVENDLMIAILVADTGTGTWSCTGWTELLRQTNTSQLCVMYRIATSSEPDDYTFTRSTSETFNGRIVSIRDIDTTNPFGSTPTYTVTNQSSAAKYTLPQVTTTVANSLILYAVSNSAAGVPSIIEGPVSLIVGEDGSAESGGVAWSFMPSTGASPNNITCSNISSGAGVKAAIQIAAPSGGATIVPAYCSSDASIYINPIHGTTAYNSDTGLAATWDTLIGTSLNGITLADATVAAAADVGINPYHSAGRLTSISGSRNWSGAALDLASGNNVNLSGKNILVHTGPSTPGQIQRFGAAASQKGTAIAMQSSSGNWKAWHVHGKGTPYGYQRDVPLIVNSSNTGGLLESAGTFDASAVDIFGFAVAGGGVSTTIWDFYSLWVLDIVTICGGIASSPIDVPGIVLAAADGHERKSIVQQGTGQAIVFQPIQIGDGGTHPTYLDLNATAIEFPKQYDLTSLQVNYCSVDNVAGITYYAGASDTIKHRSSVISSPNKYHWGFHASTSTSATYDFSGLQVIGAGTITLVNNLSLSGITWSDCDNFSSAGTYLDNCTIKTTVATSALTVSSTTNMGRITNCTFNTNNDGDIGHSIELTATGTHAFDNIAFAGGGVAKRSFNTTTGVDAGTDIITVDAAHGYVDGDAIYYQDQGGSQNMGLTDGTLYYVNAQSTTTLSFHTTKADAIANTNKVALTSAGGETHSIYSAKADVYNNSGGAVTINVSNGGTVPTVRESNGSSTTINNSVTLEINGVAQGTRCYIEAALGGPETSGTILMNEEADALGIATQTYNYTSSQPVRIRARLAGYIPFETTGTIASTGLTITAVWLEDSNYTP
ncbi:MAG: hypothetical protein HZC02_01840 [Candidatus Levybacteria bacterium]|nr:hypothetical protein [Candidatus Levybacteria bacterium]